MLSDTVNRSITGDAEPRVSVIVPCFNQGCWLGEALRSLQSQSLQDWECIVVDDGSSDGTAAVALAAAEADSRIRYVKQTNQGVSVARNVGLRYAKGVYIQFLDADDLIQCDKLRCQVGHLQENADLDIVYGPAAFFHAEDPDRLLLSRTEGSTLRFPTPSGPGVDIFRQLLRNNFLVIHAPLVRRRVFDTVGEFDSSLRTQEDWDLWLRCAVAGTRFQFMDDPNTSALVRLSGGSLTSDESRMYTFELALRERWAGRLQPGELAAINSAALAASRANLGMILLTSGQTGSGWCLLGKALRVRHALPKTLFQIALRLIPRRTAARLRSSSLVSRLRRRFG